MKKATFYHHAGLPEGDMPAIPGLWTLCALPLG